MDPIIREFPTKMTSVNNLFNYGIDDYLQCKNLINNDVFMYNYKKLLSGINYKTNRKIKRDGHLFKKLVEEFHSTYPFLSKFEKINYELLTNKKCDELIRRNKEIEIYNSIIDKVVNDIKQLKSWNDFVIFNGKKYGLPQFCDGIHKEDDCHGQLIYFHESSDGNESTTIECQKCSLTSIIRY